MKERVVDCTFLDFSPLDVGAYIIKDQFTGGGYFLVIDTRYETEMVGWWLSRTSALEKAQEIAREIENEKASR